MTGINERIIDEIRSRLEVGRKTYGHEVQLDDTRDWVQESIEEALDLAVYLSAELIRIRESIKSGQDV